jgi:hypothetical protein
VADIDPTCQSPNHGAGQRIYGDHIRELRTGGTLRYRLANAAGAVPLWEPMT